MKTRHVLSRLCQAFLDCMYGMVVLFCLVLPHRGSMYQTVNVEMLCNCLICPHHKRFQIVSRFPLCSLVSNGQPWSIEQLRISAFLCSASRCAHPWIHPQLRQMQCHFSWALLDQRSQHCMSAPLCETTSRPLLYWGA